MHPIDWITGSIIDAAMRIHGALGPGLFELVYEVVLERDLVRGGFRVERQKANGFEFEGLHFENAFVLDLLVDSKVVVEIKSVVRLALLKHGIKRIVNRLAEDPRRPSLPRVPRVK